MVIVIIAGHIDLSVGLGRRAHRRRLGRARHPARLPVVGRRARRAAVGVAVGAWQGFWVAYVGIPAFIVTLAGMLLFRGLTLQVLGQHLAVAVPGASTSSRQRLPQRTPGRRRASTPFTLLIGAVAVAGYAVSGSAPASRRIRYAAVGRVVPAVHHPDRRSSGAVVMAFAWQLAHARGLPIVLIILGVLVLAYGDRHQAHASSAATSTRSAATCPPRRCPA